MDFTQHGKVTTQALLRAIAPRSVGSCGFIVHEREPVEIGRARPSLCRSYTTGKVRTAKSVTKPMHTTLISGTDCGPKFFLQVYLYSLAVPI